jgi:hypothetical protein
MGIFNKKSESNKVQEKINQIPKLPELPKLPSLPMMNEEMELPKLPSFPNSSLGDKFSQNTIKEAVAGEEEVEPEEEVDDFSRNESQMMPMLPEKQVKRINFSESKSYSTRNKEEPIFIRLDKFEESLEIFKDTKEQISEIEHLLSDIKNLKQKEETELNDWENQIQEIKTQIEMVDKNLFSKI